LVTPGRNSTAWRAAAGVSASDLERTHAPSDPNQVGGRNSYSAAHLHPSPRQDDAPNSAGSVSREPFICRNSDAAEARTHVPTRALCGGAQRPLAEAVSREDGAAVQGNDAEGPTVCAGEPWTPSHDSATLRDDTAQPRSDVAHARGVAAERGMHDGQDSEAAQGPDSSHAAMSVVDCNQDDTSTGTSVMDNKDNLINNSDISGHKLTPGCRSDDAGRPSPGSPHVASGTNTNGSGLPGHNSAGVVCVPIHTSTKRSQKVLHEKPNLGGLPELEDLSAGVGRGLDSSETEASEESCAEGSVWIQRCDS
jgi:hypothetical protein